MTLPLTAAVPSDAEVLLAGTHNRLISIELTKDALDQLRKALDAD